MTSILSGVEGITKVLSVHQRLRTYQASLLHTLKVAVAGGSDMLVSILHVGGLLTLLRIAGDRSGPCRKTRQHAFARSLVVSLAGAVELSAIRRPTCFHQR